MEVFLSEKQFMYSCLQPLFFRLGMCSSSIRIRQRLHRVDVVKEQRFTTQTLPLFGTEEKGFLYLTTLRLPD